MCPTSEVIHLLGDQIYYCEFQLGNELSSFGVYFNKLSVTK